MPMIKKVTYDDIKHIKIETYGLDIQDKGEYYGYFVDGEIVSILNILDTKSSYHFNRNYTLPEHRRKGYFEKLLQEGMRIYNDKPIVANCMYASWKIYLRNGFNLIKIREHKYYTIYVMRWN